MPETTLGLIPGYAGTQRLSRLTGLGNALFLQLTADMIGAEDALRIGLAQKVFPVEELLDETKKIAQKIASNGPNAIKTLKQVVRQGLEMNFKNGCDLEVDEFGVQFEKDGIEGMKAFLEKRKPEW